MHEVLCRPLCLLITQAGSVAVWKGQAHAQIRTFCLQVICTMNAECYSSLMYHEAFVKLLNVVLTLEWYRKLNNNKKNCENELSFIFHTSPM